MNRFVCCLQINKYKKKMKQKIVVSKNDASAPLMVNFIDVNKKLILNFKTINYLSNTVLYQSLLQV